jgi:hypothetical protein
MKRLWSFLDDAVHAKDAVNGAIAGNRIIFISPEEWVEVEE